MCRLPSEIADENITAEPAEAKDARVIPQGESSGPRLAKRRSNGRQCRRHQQSHCRTGHVIKLDDIQLDTTARRHRFDAERSLLECSDR
jgi:hypothetical protein